MKSVKKNLVYNVMYQLMIILIPLITTPYISRVLGKEMIGLYSYSSSVAVYFGIFILLGLSNYGNRIIAMERDNGKRSISKSFFSIYALQLICGILISIIYFFYLFFISDNLLMGAILYLYLLSVILDINWFYFGMEEFRLTVTRNMVIKILSTLSIFIFVKDEHDVYLYATILSASFVVSQLILFLFLKNYIVFVKIKIRDVLVHVKPNLVLFIPVIAVSIYKIMDKVMLGIFTSYSEVGIYESSEKLISIPTAFITALGTVMLPRTTNLISQGKIKESRKYLNSSLILSVFLSSALCFGIIAILPEFVPIFYGPGYEKCIQVISIVVLSSIFLSWGNVIRTQYLIPMHKDNVYVKSAIYGAIVNFVINFILIFNYKSVGTAIGTLIAEGVVCVYQCYKIRKCINFKKYLVLSFPFLFLAITMCFMLINIHLFEDGILNLIIKVIIGSIYYLSFSGLLLYYMKKKHLI